MSRLEELKEELKTSLQTTWDRIQESEIYNQLNDRYQSMTPSGQKITQIVVAVSLTLIIFYTPLTQVQVSQEMLFQFQEKRDLIRNLFKTYRESSAQAQIDLSPEPADLIARVQSFLQNSRLVPDQIISVNLAEPEGQLIPRQLQKAVVEVKLSKLNLRQIVDIGLQLTNISSAVKVKDMSLQAHAEMAGYFDVIYKLYALNVPQPAVEEAPEINSNGRNNRRNNNKSGDE